MTDLSYSSTELAIFIPITGVLKYHDLMNQNLPSFSCLRKITSIISFYKLFQHMLLIQMFGVHKETIEMNISKIGIILTITNKSISNAPPPPPLRT